MVDPSLLSVQSIANSTQVVPQPLPNAQTADVAKFRDLLSGISAGDGSMQPSQLDNSVLQRTDPIGQVENNTSLKDTLINKITGIDQSYHSILEQSRKQPDFSSYVQAAGGTTTDQVAARNYPAVSAPAGMNAEDRMASLIDRMQKDNVASINYQRDLTNWTMNFQMWSSGVELASSVVSQLSKGFQTLFRASG